jgi:hypothetical protein
MSNIDLKINGKDNKNGQQGSEQKHMDEPLKIMPELKTDFDIKLQPIKIRNKLYIYNKNTEKKIFYVKSIYNILDKTPMIKKLDIIHIDNNKQYEMFIEETSSDKNYLYIHNGESNKNLYGLDSEKIYIYIK